MNYIKPLTIFLAAFILYSAKTKPSSLNSYLTENTNDSIQTDTVYYGVDKVAQYPGGITEAYNFIKQNIQHPDSYLTQEITGKVVTKFIVRKSGTIDSIQIIKGLNIELDNEAIRLISLFPNWTPAQINGKNVSSFTTFPIIFEVKKETKDSIHINQSLIHIPVILDSVQMPDNFNITAINPDLISSGNFITPYPKSVRDSLVNKYGVNAKYGVMIINTVKPSVYNPSKTSNTHYINNNDTIWLKTDECAEFPGGTSALHKFLKANIIYPPFALQCKIKGCVEAYFSVTQSGEIKDITFESGGSPILYNEVIRVIKMLPQWIPAKKNNINVNSIVSIPFCFTISKGGKPDILFEKITDNKIPYTNQPLVVLDGKVLPTSFDIALLDPSKRNNSVFYKYSKELSKNYGKNAENGLLEASSIQEDLLINTVEYIDSVKTTNGEHIYEVIEQMPQFPGGESALLNFLMKNIQYPAEALQKGISGQVITRFVVDQYGRVGNVEVFKSPSPLLDAEAIRIIKSLPRWIPGMQNGQCVSVYFTLPINFKLH